MKFTSFPLTQSQLRRLETSDRVGNPCIVFRLTGAVDKAKLKRAVDILESECEIFSHRFLRMQDSMHIIRGNATPQGLRCLEAPEDETATVQLIESLCHHPFRLDSGAPYLFALLESEKYSNLIFSCHPVLMDRFSLGALAKALSLAYNSEASATAKPQDFNIDQDTLLQQEAQVLNSSLYLESLNFWMKLCKESNFEWHPGRSEEDLNSFYFNYNLPPHLTKNFRSWTQSQRLTDFSALLFSFHILLTRMTNSESVLTSFFHRIDEGSHDRMAFNENKLPLKSFFSPGLSTQDYFFKASQLWDQMLHHGAIPARSLAQELLRMEPDFKRITNVLFTEDCLPYADLNLKGVQAQLMPLYSYRLEDEDIAIHVDARENISMHILARSPQAIPALKTALRHFEVFLSQFQQHLPESIHQTPIFNPELEKMALAFSHGEPLQRTSKDTVDLFLESVARNPAHIALETRASSVSFQELLESMQSLATLMPAQPGTRLGIFLPRSVLYVEALMATQWRGCAYVPLDLSMPEERLAWIASDGKLGGILVNSESLSLWLEVQVRIPELKNIPLINVGEKPARRQLERTQVPGSTISYMIYTSGTTGRPKGVPVSRQNLSHLMSSLSQAWPFEGHERYSEFAAFTFDATILGLFYPLTHGLSVLIIPTELRTDPEALFQLLIDKEISHAEVPPAMLSLLPRKNAPALKRLICGGEAIDEEAVRFWSKAVELCNCYGPTEATVMCTMTYLEGAKTANLLGRPIPGYQVLLLNEVGELTPLGGVGEICVAGAGVCDGYFDRPELNKQKFVSNRWAEKIYRTGDLGRFLPNGDLEFLGRSDFQVKIRGFRIELGEIEAAISEQPEIHQCFVTVVDHSGEKALAAWYVLGAKSSSFTASALKERLSSRLPHYMVPNLLRAVAALPLTLHGKIDRALLVKEIFLSEKVPTLGLDPLHAQIRGIWQEVLKLPVQDIQTDSHFFHLGGHSLSASLVCSRLGKALGLNIRPKLLFNNPVFQDFCRQIKSLKPDNHLARTLQAMNQSEVEVKNRMVRLMYSRAISQPNDNTYNIVTSIIFQSGLDTQKLKSAFLQLMSENPIFSCAFHEEGSSLFIQKQETALPEISELEVSAEEFNDSIHAYLDQSRSLSLGVQHSPLWRARILNTKEQGPTALLFSIHHSIFDGWSLNLFIEELGQRYEQKVLKNKLTYLDYCAQPQSPAELERDFKYWQKKLSAISGLSPEAKVDLPVQSHQTRANSNRYIDFKIGAKMTLDLKRLSEEWNVTLPPLLFSLFNIWIWRLSNQEDLIIGYPYAGRDEAGTEDIYGAFVKIAFLRSQISPMQELRHYVQGVHRQMIEDKDHMTLAPYDAELDGMDSLNVIFSLQSGIGLSGVFLGSPFYAEELPSLTAKGDITGIFYERPESGTLDGRIEFDGAKFSETLMQDFIKIFENVLSGACENPERRVLEIPYLSSVEQSDLLAHSVGPTLDIDDHSIPEGLHRTVLRKPSGLALVFKEKSYTYAELWSAVQSLSSLLAAQVKPGDRIGLCATKGDAAVIALLALQYLGATYVPLDSSYPADRLKYFLKNTGLKKILADKTSLTLAQGLGEGVQVLVLEDLLQGKASSAIAYNKKGHQEAYIIHTSGSTGLPKGVSVLQGSVVRMVHGAAEQIQYPESAHSPLYGSLSFDTSVIEIFLPLLTGATLFIVPENLRKDPEAVFEFLKKNKISHAILSPALLQSLPRETLPDLEVLGFGGDSIDENTADWWSRQVNLLSCYGPTETTVQCSSGLIEPGGNPRTIGRPQAGYRMYLLNKNRQLVPRGCFGEIFIGGEQCAVGYLNLPQKTQESFILDPFSESPYARMYKTGDLGRLIKDENIEFLGRQDGQVKVRGFRIEFGEIEDRISQFAGIEHAVVTIFGKGQNRYLAGYYTVQSGAAQDAVKESALRDHLSHFLPEYMVPSFLVQIRDIPMSLNGKVDRKRLPEPDQFLITNPPRPGLETDVARVWQKVLSRAQIPRDQSFFHWGGNSLLAVRLQKELLRDLGLKLSIADIYTHPTIEKMAGQTTGSSQSLAAQDARLKFEKSSSPEKPAESIRSVLLTGANGFLGIYLLQELQRRGLQVKALIRTSDMEQGLKSLQSAALRAGLPWNPVGIEVIAGDLAQEKLGLSADSLNRLRSVDAILHCGAFVHHLHSYSTLRAANVLGTKALLELAQMGPKKRFGFVSTIGVAAATATGSVLSETISENPPQIESGYILSKWVGEKLVQAAHKELGLSTVVLRAGNITGDRKTGYSNFEQNHFWLFHKGCLQLGHYPDFQRQIEMMPVDLLAQIMVEVFLNAPAGLEVCNLTHPQHQTQDEFYAQARAAGFAVTAEPVSAWQERLKTIDEKNGLYSIREFYQGALESEPEIQIQQDSTLRFLKNQGIDLTLNLPQLVPMYLKYLRSEKFI
jgi:amino acid adenylation domain-containing protein/thioester reductase-like protein